MSKFDDWEFDIVVAGSGPAGISTAIHMAKLLPSVRNRMIVLEKATHPREKACGGGLSPYADDWLKRLDIKMSITSLDVNRMRFVVDHDEYVEQDVLLPAGLRAVVREEFDQALVHEAISLGIPVAQNEPVLSYTHRDEIVAVQTSKRTLTTRMLVGADGSKSTVRRRMYQSLGARGPRTTCSSLCLMGPVAGVGRSGHQDREGVIDFSCTFQNGIRGYAWSFPVMIRGEMGLNVGIGGFYLPHGQKRPLRQVLTEFLKSRGISMDRCRLKTHPIRWFHPASVLSSPRVLLVGDAAGTDPLWGEGISFALGYGEVAATAVRHALENGDFSFSTYKDRLLGHEVGRELMRRFGLADRLYRSPSTENDRDLLLSLLLPGRAVAGS